MVGNNVKPVPIGTVRIRTRHKRSGEQRAWVKVAEPNEWKLRAQVVWEEHHGPIPRGMVVHHRDENKLNDAIENLQLLTKAKHLDEHRAAYLPKSLASLIQARRSRRWSTKSATKHTGRPPTYPVELMNAAVAEVGVTEDPNVAAIARKHGVSPGALYCRLKRVYA
jgi:hypothetical protein